VNSRSVFSVELKLCVTPGFLDVVGSLFLNQLALYFVYVVFGYPHM
jgi:hypothetical protein